MKLLRIFLLIAAFASLAVAILPGVAPREYEDDEELDLKVNKLTSVRTQLPYKYYQRMPFCQPKEIVDKVENLGEILLGDRIENSDYVLKAGVDYQCKVLCKTDEVKQDELKDLVDLIENEYRASWVLDNLPAAMPKILQSVSGETTTLYETGFPVGFVGDPQEQPGTAAEAVYLNNHVNIKVLYHTNPDAYDGRRVVGFEVEPESIAHSMDFDTADEDAVPATCLKRDTGPLLIDASKESQQFVFTYSVTWEYSDIAWVNRWDQYLINTDAQIHWFSIINSLMIVVFLSAMVAMIMMRTLYKDFRRYNQLEPNEEAEETGWKLVHGDVFRPPQKPMLLAVIVGSGVQVGMCALILLVFAVLGFLSPANRGGLVTAMTVLFTVMGVFAGYFATRLYKLVKGQYWKKCTLMTAFGFPGFCFGIFFILNLMIWGEKSSGAVPFTVLCGLIALWFGVSLPLVFFGAYFAFKKPVAEMPVGTNQIPRQIPEQVWYLSPVISVLMSGVLPFGAVFIELFFVLSAVYGHQFYYIFSFLFLVFCILIVTCAEISIVMIYFSLSSEDYHWWWKSVLSSGSSALYVFIYSAFYFESKLEISKTVSAILFYGYSLVTAACFFVLTGAIGFYASLTFIQIIYSSVKVD